MAHPPDGGDERRAAGCLGKHPYPNGTLAWRVARKYGVAIYRCANCGHWHVGGLDTVQPGTKLGRRR